MNNNLSVQALANKNKNQLLEMIKEAVEFAEFGSEDEEYQAFEQIESVVYVLRNCEYEGKE